MLGKGILDQLIPIVSPNLRYEQFGLCKKRSTIIQLLLSQTNLGRTGDETCDSSRLPRFTEGVRHSGHKSGASEALRYGSSKVPSWYSQSYLNNRTQHVAIDGGRSTSLTVHSGVAQGSLFAPTLFLPYVYK